MCGIAGSLSLEGRPALDEAIVAAMTDALSHRGPDDAGMLIDHPVVLGHRRLSILDLSPAGHQPMTTPDRRYWITFNGEIYNYRELARDLRGRGHRFASSSDTEVLLAAYSEWGAGCLERLNGMFAFAIWDRIRKRLFCARDRFAVKPFYYAVVDGSFRFASEIKALLVDPAVSRSPDDGRVAEFLAFGLTDHHEGTMFRGISQLPPGSYLVVQPGAPVGAPTQWYVPAPATCPPATAVGTMRHQLTDAVRLRLRSDVPVGTTLSGGLDSSSISAIAATLRQAEHLPLAPSFSSRCLDPRVDEGPYIDAVSGATGAPNYSSIPSEGDLVSNLDHVLWHMDEPFHSAAVFAQWKVCALARSHGVEVLLDGQGGDEALAGYDYLLYPGFVCTQLRSGRLGSVVRELRARERVQGTPIERSIKELVRTILPNGLRTRRPPGWLHWETIPIEPLPGRTLLRHHLHGLQVQPLPAYNRHADRNAMSVALESRNPFLDYRVVELGLGLRPTEHLHNGFTKWTLRQAVRDLLPAQVVDRGRKQGFTTDESEWIRSGLLGEMMEEDFRSASFASRGYFDVDALLSALEAHRSGLDRAPELWRAFVVNRWFSLFVDPPRLEAPGRSECSPVTERRAADAVMVLDADRTIRRTALDG